MQHLPIFFLLEKMGIFINFSIKTQRICKLLFTFFTNASSISTFFLKILQITIVLSTIFYYTRQWTLIFGGMDK